MALMDSYGRQKARIICESVETLNFNHQEFHKNILDERNMILDEVGVLTEKTKEGLETIAENIGLLYQHKSSLLNVVAQEGIQLENAYIRYQNSLNDETTEDVSASSSESSVALGPTEDN